MTKEEIIRAWKDEAYRSALSGAELAQLPENPAGIIDLSDAQLGGVGGRDSTIYSLIIEGSVALSTGITLIALTNYISCYQCSDTVLSGGSCRVSTAGCCGEQSTGGGGDTAL